MLEGFLFSYMYILGNCQNVTEEKVVRENISKF